MTKRKAAKKKTAVKKTAKKPRSKAQTQTIIASRNAVHGFDNAEILVLQQSLIVAKAFEQNASRNFSYQFLQALAKSVPSYRTQLFSGPAFRAVPPGKKLSALDDRATFSAGGRVNIGMKQQEPIFTGPICYAQGGIYCSKDAQTARMEYESIAPGAYDMVQLEHAVGQYCLLDFDSMVHHLDNLLLPESISSRVNSSPYDGAWKYQPFPLASQLLGNWLRLHTESQVDGLFFRSSKDPHGTNFFIFHPSKWKIF
jgi:hypothetical protein